MTWKPTQDDLCSHFQGQSHNEADHEPNFAELAAFVEGRLGWWRRWRMRRHLADCRTCRSLILALMDEVDQTPAVAEEVKPTRVSALIAARWTVAAGMAGAIGLVIVQATSSTVPEAWFERAADPALATTWSVAEESVYRHGQDAMAALALSPRWSIVQVTRPAFRWRYATDATRRDVRLMVIDADQRLVGQWTVQADAESFIWPSDSPPLKSGESYAWKLVLWTDDGPLTTRFMPFRVAPASTSRHQPAALDLQKRIEHGRFDLALLQLLELSTGELELDQAQRRHLIDQLVIRLRLTATEKRALGLQP